MKKLSCVLAIVLTMCASAFASINIFGKVTDTTTGVALDSVIVKLGKHCAVADTTTSNGIFSLTGNADGALNGIVSKNANVIRCAGANVHFTVRQQTRVSVEAFGASGKFLAKPFDKLVMPGAYRIPVGLCFATQIIYIRVACGSDVRVFRMQGSMSRGRVQIKYDAADSKQAPLLKSEDTAMRDTLLVTRNNYGTRKFIISSYTSTDSIRIMLWPGNASDSLGGRLYDRFWAARSGFSQTDTALIGRLNKYADFFRCEQCHGYDLLGKAGTYGGRTPSTSRPNVCGVKLTEAAAESCKVLFKLIKTGDDSTKRRSLATDVAGYDPASSAATGDKMPNYGGILTDKQIWDLVKFLKNGYIDGKLIYDCTVSGTYPTATVAFSNIGKDGDTAAGNTLYSSGCKGCHGADGKYFLLDGKSFSVGSHVRKKPNEDVHQIKYHLFGSFPNYSAQQLKNLFKALADTIKYPTPTKDDSICYSSDGISGGRMYDLFWVAETTFNQTDTARYNQYAKFFSCAQCHGFDLLGRKGSFANRASNATTPNVADVDLFAASSESTTELFKLVKTGDDSTKRRAPADNPASSGAVGDKMPKYSAILTDKEIWNIVKFFKNEAFDTKQLYDCTVTGTYPTATVAYSNIGKTGTAASGNTYYTANCTGCHNADGKKFLIDGLSVGAHLRANPAEDYHKIKFGVLGSNMKNRTISIAQMKDLFKALSDTTAFPK